MLRPTISQIATKGESYYSVVIAVAKRAREISDELCKDEHMILEQKPVKTAVEEFAARKYLIVEDPSLKSALKTE